MPPAAMTDAPPRASLLVPFCQFLLHRVQSSNLELLKRAVSEFLAEPRSFQTVESMLELGMPLVTVLPLDNDDPIEREKADAILMRMQSVKSTCDEAAHFDELQTALAAKVELKNWDWLHQIYVEFCVGHDLCLREFIQLQRQSISVLPVRPIAAVVVAEPPRRKRGRPRKHPPVTLIPTTAPPAVSPSTLSTPTTLGKPAVATRTKPSKAAVESAKPRVPSRLPIGIEPSTKNDIRDVQSVLAEYFAIEAQKPWEKLFDLGKIEYPFDDSKYPALAQALQRFWGKFTFAVWERQFWLRFPSPEDVWRHEDRKHRQDAAARSFESWVIAPVYEALGPQFFVDLDEQPQRHYWWWYRGPVVDLTDVEPQRALTYLNTYAHARFPVQPCWLTLRKEKSRSPSASMWAALKKHDKYRRTIGQLKQERQVASGSRDTELVVEDGSTDLSDDE